MLKPKPKQETLRDRIEAIHKEVDELVAQRAAEIKQACFNQPLESIEQLIRRGQCRCTVGLRLSLGDD